MERYLYSLRRKYINILKKVYTMIYIVILVITSILVIITLYLMNINFYIRYKYDGNINIVEIQIKTGFGFIRYNIEAPWDNFLEIIQDDIDKSKFISNIAIKTKDDDKIIDQKKDNIISAIIDNILIIKDIYNDYSYPINYLGKRMEIENFFLNISFGLQDAFWTSLIYGLSSTFIISLFSILRRRIRINSAKVELVPAFKDVRFKAEVSCIIKARLGHIITSIKMTDKYSKKRCCSWNNL